jgi:hypothetical protein
MAMAVAALLTFGLPALAESQTPPRTPWKKVDPASDKVVRRVVEGCAAYPVTAEGPAAKLTANAEPPVPDAARPSHGE